MAIKLSDDARDFLINNRKYLQKNDLKSLYSDELYYVDDKLALEVCDFLYEKLGDKLFTFFDKIPDSMFNGSKRLKNVSIPNNISSIGESAFANSSIRSLSLNQGVELIEANAFKDCKRLFSVDLGETRVIKSGAFAGCDALRQIYLPESVSILGKEVFPNNILITSPKRKVRSLRFPKNELEWYKDHLVLDSSQYEEEEEE